MHIEDRVEIAASTDAVWALTMDVERWPDITPTITSVDRLGDEPFGIGSQARIKQPRQRATTWAVTQFDPGKTFVWATSTLGMRMEGGHHLEGDDHRTVNTLTLEVTGPLASTLGRLVAGQFRKAIQTENQGFKRVAEAG